MKRSKNTEQADMASQEEIAPHSEERLEEIIAELGGYDITVRRTSKWIKPAEYLAVVYMAVGLISLTAFTGWMAWNSSNSLSYQIHRLDKVEQTTKALQLNFEALAERESGDNPRLPADAAILKRISSIEDTLATSPSEVLNVAIMGQRLVALDDSLRTMESRVAAEIDRLYGFFMGTIVAAIVSIFITLLLVRRREA